ncbi:MAG: hypothetical protein JWQ09_5290 [Segetibacter sp.]|nr:hypothetical protein [Segetibacter sp.]
MTNDTALCESKAVTEQDTGLANISRRKFLNYAGASTGLVLLAASCKKNDSGGVDLGSGDTGVLNYAYALEQLEAAFYIQVVAGSYYASASADEKTYLKDIRDHEIAHREFFKATLAGSAIPALEVDFSSVNFADRASVLGTARAFEDLGVSAYNGAGSLLTNAAYLTVAGKIVSVEARHAAWIRDLLTADTFVAADVVNLSTGLEMSRTPSQVLSIAGNYIKTKINASNLPS